MATLFSISPAMTATSGVIGDGDSPGMSSAMTATSGGALVTVAPFRHVSDDDLCIVDGHDVVTTDLNSAARDRAVGARRYYQ